MNWHLVRTFLVIAILAPLVWGLFLLLGSRGIQPIAGAALVTSGKLCHDRECLSGEPLALPYFSKAERVAGLTSQTLEFRVDNPTASGEVQTIYLPKFADDIAISVNGTWLRQSQDFENHWNKPLMLPIPASLLHEGEDRIILTLTGPAQQKLELQPFFVGPKTALATAFAIRQASTASIAQFGLGLMAVLTVVFVIIWLARRGDAIYFYLAASCVAAAMICIQYGFDTSGLPYRLWTIVWGYSTPVYVLLIAKIVATHLRIDLGRAEWVSLLLIGLMVTIAFLVPAGWVHSFVMNSNLLTAVGATLTSAWFWLHRHRANPVDFLVMFGSMSIALLFGYNVLYMLLAAEPGLSVNLYQFMPLVMTGMCLWLIISRLLTSLKDLEALAQVQQDAIAAKSHELEESYRQLAAIQQRKAIGDERQRIMLDLHDGLGGHLVNALAYMENKGVEDATLRRALEDALRDLALMLDSLETEDSISTLLGMLRTRLEALLENHGIEFEWRILEEPKLTHPGPSQNLNLLRIVQEAITNVVKHAHATRITISSDPSSVIIRDNGKGFDLAALQDRRGGHGIIGMRRRARQIGADLQLSSSSAGTEIRLVWPDVL